MEKFQRIDDWLIDRIFQPVVSWYEYTFDKPWWLLSVILLGLQYFTIAAALTIDVALKKNHAYPASDLFLAAVITILGCISMWGRARAAKRIRTGVSNPYRTHKQGARFALTWFALVFVAVWFVLMMLEIKGGTEAIALLASSLLCAYASEYFFACNGMTPEQRKEREEKELLKHAPQPI